MIVKEVPAKKANRSFGSLASYMLDNNKMPHLDSYHFTNCPYDNKDITQNIQHIINFQNTNQRTKSDKTLHLVVSFAEGEKPKKEELNDIEEQLVKSIGLQEHQRFSVVHDNTNNYHIHIAVNKIHPQTNNIVSPYQSHSKLHKKARELEEHYHLSRDVGKKIELNKKEIKTDERREQQSKKARVLESSDRSTSRQEQTRSLNNLRNVSDIPLVHNTQSIEMLLQSNEYNNLGLRQIRSDTRMRRSNNGNVADGTSREGELARDQPPQESPKNKDIEIHSGIKNLTTWLKEEVLEDLLNIIKNENSAFDDLQKALADANLELRARGNGMVIAHKSRKLFVKPSSIHRGLSKQKLEKRYGTLEFKSFDIKATKMFGLPKHNFWDEYQQDSQQKKEAKKKLFSDAKSENLELKEKIKAKYDQLIQETKKDLFINRKTKRIIYTNLFERRKNEYKQLSTEYKAKRDNIFKSTNQISYKEYLIQRALEGDQTALMVLRASKPKKQEDEKSIIGKTDHKIFVTRDRLITKKGLVVYKVGDNGKIIDKGDRLKITVDDNEEALKEMLTMAMAKYGNDLDINGDIEFKRRVLKVVDKFELKIKFKDKTMQEIQDIQKSNKQQAADKQTKLGM